MTAVVSLSLSAGEIRWFGDYEKGRLEAVKNQKSILLLIDNSRGEHIKRFTSSIYSDKRLQECIADRYIPIIVKEGGDISYPIELFYTTIYPVIFIANPNNEIPIDSMHDKSFRYTDLYKFACN